MVFPGNNEQGFGNDGWNTTYEDAVEKADNTDNTIIDPNSQITEIESNKEVLDIKDGFLLVDHFV